jgi:hypothetical protein
VLNGAVSVAASIFELHSLGLHMLFSMGPFYFFIFPMPYLLAVLRREVLPANFRFMV